MWLPAHCNDMGVTHCQGMSCEHVNVDAKAAIAELQPDAAVPVANALTRSTVFDSHVALPVKTLTMAASSALFLPVDTPTPSMAVPLLHMMDLTSAKSTLTSPGMVMMSEIPCTPCSIASQA